MGAYVIRLTNIRIGRQLRKCAIYLNRQGAHKQMPWQFTVIMDLTYVDISGHRREQCHFHDK